MLITGNTDLVSLLLEQGAIVTATDHNGSTPLHLACQKGQQSTVVSYDHSIDHVYTIYNVPQQDVGKIKQINVSVNTKYSVCCEACKMIAVLVNRWISLHTLLGITDRVLSLSSLCVFLYL